MPKNAHPKVRISVDVADRKLFGDLSEDDAKLAELAAEATAFVGNLLATPKTLDVIVRVPDRKTLGEFEKWVDKAPDKAKEILINACVLTHKDEVKADDGLFMAAFDALSKILPYRSATIKNL